MVIQAALTLVIGVAGCSSNDSEQPTELQRRPSVFTVNYPLQYFAQRIGGDVVDVHLPVPAGVDPADWQPEAETIVEYQRADLILLNGAGYAGWVERVTLPSSKFVNTSESFRDRYMTIESSITHQHGPRGEHSHGDIAFTTWLDPMLAIEQSRVILNAFSNAWPEQSASFKANFRNLEKDLTALDAELQRSVAPLLDRPLLASHPVYQYLIRRYDLDVISVHWEPDEHPGDDEWASLRALLSGHPATLMLWEGKPRDETRRSLHELGIECIVITSCGSRPATGDYLSVMRDNVAALEIN